MRFLSAQIFNPRYRRDREEVEATVALIIGRSDEPGVKRVKINVSSPARAPGAAPLRERLLAQAKLCYITGRVGREGTRSAA